MKLMSYSAASEFADKKKFVLLLGMGLIGYSVYSALLRAGWQTEKDYTFLWDNIGFQSKQLKQSLSDLVSINSKDRTRTDIHIVWCAGKAGFSSPNSAFEDEGKSFSNLVDFAEFAKSEASIESVYFHHMSSAGGLYEGQSFVDLSSKPAPLRPYGFEKLRQEKLLQSNQTTKGTYMIYRPSSIYGFQNGGRTGLVSTLILNALKGDVSRIFGGINTLRDFIYIEDIGNFVCAKINEISIGGSVFFLASGKPTSTYEVISNIEYLTHKKLYIQYETTLENALNNSFRNSSLSGLFAITPLGTGVKKTLEKIRSNKY